MMLIISLFMRIRLAELQSMEQRLIIRLKTEKAHVGAILSPNLRKNIKVFILRLVRITK